MSFNIKIDDSELTKIAKSMSDDELRQALEDAGQLIISSTKIGYQKQVDPEGKKWKANPAWYMEMKGTDKALSGPTSKTIKGGKYAGKYQFQKVNVSRMQNLLKSTVSVIQKRVQISYDTKKVGDMTKPRDELTQEGGEGKIILTKIGGGSSIEMNVKVQPRVHLGVAEDYARLGTKTDPEHVEEVFGVLVDKHLGV